MKKLILCLIAAVIFCFGTACTAQVQPDAPAVPADTELHCTIYEEQLPEFSFTHIYGNPEEQPTWFWVNSDITDAAIVAINYDEETYAPTGIGDVLYSFGNVAAGEGILLYMEMPEGFPIYAITYTVSGETFTFAMGYSGIDGSTTITSLEELI